MIYNKLIITFRSEILDSLVQKYTLVLIEKTNQYEIYEWKIWENSVLILQITDTFSWIDKIVNNYQFLDTLVIWDTQVYTNFDYKIWDVVIPNTLVTSDWKDPIFMEINVWENYDLNNFWLILNWVCLSRQIFESFEELNCDWVDLVVDNYYEYINYLVKEKKDTSVRLLIVLNNWEDQKFQSYINNLILILELIID